MSGHAEPKTTSAPEPRIPVTPYTIDVPQSQIEDLLQRLRQTRWPETVSGAGWNYGVELDYLKGLCDRWATTFDWSAQQKRLNRFAHQRAMIDGTGLHFIHQRGDGADAVPLLLLHGWPSSFVQMLRIIPLLTAGPGSFDVVCVSLPGYAFSDQPAEAGMSLHRIAELCHGLMTELGYDRYATRGTDMGLGVLKQLALACPEALIGIHQGGTNPHLGRIPRDLSEAEGKFVADAEQWTRGEGSYAMQHSTKPQTLAVGLNDSPAGLAAWIMEKFHRWTDGDLAEIYDADDLLTNLTIYWVTQTIGSSIRLYYETAHDQNAGQGRVEVPTALAMTRDLFPTPREWVDRSYNVVRWTELDQGGHFPEWEVPQLIADDLRAFYHHDLR